MATLKDVAKRANVSIATVSSVINNSRPVAEETKRRVMKAIQEVGYKAKRSNGRAGKVLYVVPSVANITFTQYMGAIQRTLMNAGYDLVLCNNEARRNLTVAYMNHIRKADVDGVIVTQTSTCGQIIADACRRNGIPLVVLQAPDVLDDVSMVLSDEERGVREAVAHLFGYGHRDMAFVMVKGSRLHEKRLIGYRRELETINVEYRPELVVKCNAHDEMSAYAHLKEYLDSNGCTFTALICCNDFMALGVMRALEETGIRVPEDVSLIGHDDSIATYTSPQLTSIAIRKTQLAETAVRILLQQIEEGKQATRRIVFPPSLIVRGSTKVKLSAGTA